MGFGVIGLVLLYLGSFFSDPAVAKILDISSLAEVRTPTPSFSTSSDADFAANQYPGEVPHITEIAFYIDQPALEKARELLGVVDAWTILGDETQQILTDYIHRTVLKSNRSFAMSGVPSILHVVDIVFSDGVHFGLGLHPDIHQSIQETQPDIIAFVLDDIPGPAAGSASWENQSLRIEVEQIIRSGENPQFSNHVFSHEVGHILKMNHDPNAHNYPCTNTHCGTYFAVPTVCDPLSPHFSDEACPNEASHRTLMAYPDPEVGFFRSQSFVFSGPDIRYSHTWTGTDQADNRKAGVLNAAPVSTFRTSVNSYTNVSRFDSVELTQDLPGLIDIYAKPNDEDVTYFLVYRRENSQSTCHEDDFIGVGINGYFRDRKVQANQIYYYCFRTYKNGKYGIPDWGQWPPQSEYVGMAIPHQVTRTPTIGNSLYSVWFGLLEYDEWLGYEQIRFFMSEFPNDGCSGYPIHIAETKYSFPLVNLSSSLIYPGRTLYFWAEATLTSGEVLPCSSRAEYTLPDFERIYLPFASDHLENQIDFHWLITSAAPSVDGFVIYRSTQSLDRCNVNAEGVEVGIVSEQDLEIVSVQNPYNSEEEILSYFKYSFHFEEDEEEDGDLHYFSIQAYHEMSFLNCSFLTIGATKEAWAPPKNFRATEGTVSEAVHLSWAQIFQDDPSSTGGYVIYRKEVDEDTELEPIICPNEDPPEGWETHVKISESGVGFYKDEEVDVAGDTKYQYLIRAIYVTHKEVCPGDPQGSGGEVGWLDQFPVVAACDPDTSTLAHTHDHDAPASMGTVAPGDTVPKDRLPDDCFTEYYTTWGKCSLPVEGWPYRGD